MLEKLVIDGGRRLEGVIDAAGAKNSALPVLASTILSREPSLIHNVPRLKDVETTIKLLRLIGAEVRWEGEETLFVHCPEVQSIEAPYDLVRTMRASVLLLGPLLARCGQARISLPGGCAIGARPIDQHLKGLSALGCQARLSEGYVEAYGEELYGSSFRFDLPTVTGTQNIMMAACLADGMTRIHNAACEPEVVDLAHSLVSRGAEIQGAGSPEITICGGSQLGGLDHQIIADRIETGTYLVAAAMTEGKIRVNGGRRDHLEAVLSVLKKAGCQIRCSAADEATPWIELESQGRPQPFSFTTEVFPGFPTDMQAQLMALASIASGRSTICETIFENRFMHVNELQRMGAQLTINGNTVTVDGVEQLSAAPVMATDLRASASLVIAALAAQGSSEVRRIYHLDRGYAMMDDKLRSLGAKLERHKQE